MAQIQVSFHFMDGLVRPLPLHINVCCRGQSQTCASLLYLTAVEGGSL